MVRDPGSRKMKHPAAAHGFLFLVIVAGVLAPAGVLPAFGAITGTDPVSRADRSDQSAAAIPDVRDVLPPEYTAYAAPGVRVRLAQRVGGRGGGTVGGTTGGGGSNSSASDDKAVESEPEGRRATTVFKAKPAQSRVGRFRKFR